MHETWLQIVDRILTIQNRIKRNGSVPWFRGHRDKRWKLESTLHRHIKRLLEETGTKTDPNDEIALLREEYKSLFRHFKTDSWQLLEAPERSEWGIVFCMRHHGIPTRLLDWTESFACALYFAQLGRDPKEDAAIFVLDPQELNTISLHVEGLVHLDEDTNEKLFDVRLWHPQFKPPKDNLPSFAATPIFTNARMLAQRAGFVVCGDSFDSLEDQFVGKSKSQGILEKIDLPSETCSDAEMFVELAGLNAFNFFPDKEGLKLKYEEQTRKTIWNAKKFYPQNQ